MTTASIPRLETGIRNLDALLGGGLPVGSVTVVSGPPGSGKTTLAQQICFHHATPERPVLYFGTLSEPTAKALRHLAQFSFFDPAKFESAVRFVDLGEILRADGLEPASALLMEHITKVRPALVVIDSFKVFDDLARSREELRKFGYQVAVNLMAWEVTALLLGEYAPADHQTNPLFSIVDGLIAMTHREASGEPQRFATILKMRGTAHSLAEHAYVITPQGVEVFAPRETIQRLALSDPPEGQTRRMVTGMATFDVLLADGIPRGSSLLVAGVAGTGKTMFLLDFLRRGAEAGERGIIFSFEETDERLRAAALGVGWDMAAAVRAGLIEVVFTPQPDIAVEAHLEMMRERVERFGAQRVAVDSLSVFLHKVTDPRVSREKTFQLASVVQRAGAVGLFATDIPYGSPLVSRFGVEETVVDGVVLLTAVEEGMERQRYIEVYKLRNTAHLSGRHALTIGADGVRVFPRRQFAGVAEVPPIKTARRLLSGVAGLDALLGGGLFERSATLVSGSAGVGKSTFGMQFLLEGASHGEPGLFVTIEEGGAQLMESADALGLPLREAVSRGAVEILHMSRASVRAAQYATTLSERITAIKARRVVLDNASHAVSDARDPERVREFLSDLVACCKSLGATSLVTLEAQSLFSSDALVERGISPIADNLLVLRYVRAAGRMHPAVTVVKTRGSAHDWETHFVDIERGGLRVGARVEEEAALGAMSGAQKSTESVV